MTKIRPPCLFRPSITNSASRQALAYSLLLIADPQVPRHPKRAPFFSGRRGLRTEDAVNNPNPTPVFFRSLTTKSRGVRLQTCFQTFSNRALNSSEYIFRSARALTPHNVPRFLRDVSARAEAVITGQIRPPYPLLQPATTFPLKSRALSNLLMWGEPFPRVESQRKSEDIACRLEQRESLLPL